MANSKIHVRPNGELGKCSAKIKCDYAGEGAVHFEGPNAVADANAFQEKVATYIAFQESGGKFPADAEFDEDIVKFVMVRLTTTRAESLKGVRLRSLAPC